MSRKPKTPAQKMVAFGSPAESDARPPRSEPVVSTPTVDEVGGPAIRRSTRQKPKPQGRGPQAKTPTKERRSPGRPPVHKEGSRAVSVVLRPCDENAITELLQMIEDANGAHLSVSELVRGCIQGIHASSLEVGLAATERQLAELIAREIDTSVDDP
jgi:hypothetical protein